MGKLVGTLLHEWRISEIGTGTSIVIVDVGAAGALTTTIAKPEIYAFFST